VIAKPFLAAVLLSATACSVAEPNLLGGREKCWSESDPHAATLMKGWVELDTDPPVMHTPEGEDFSLEFPFLAIRSTDHGPELTDDGATVAENGELITVFGGLGSDGAIAVCAVEERHDG
jgi:hypothetical protein